ncbi:MAG: hypothetical protein MZV63_62985 [Marinilabiliales bacterium]|nr:hypothetical protein [Marinilabiliales bacterium]
MSRRAAGPADVHQEPWPGARPPWARRWPGGRKRGRRPRSRAVKDGHGPPAVSAGRDLLVSEISLGSSPLPDPDLLQADHRPRRQLHRHLAQLRQRQRRAGRSAGCIKDVGPDRGPRAPRSSTSRPRDTPASIVASVHGSLRRLGVDDDRRADDPRRGVGRRPRRRAGPRGLSTG